MPADNNVPSHGGIFADWPRDFRLLAVAVFGVGVFFGVLLTLFNNFIVDRFGIEPHHLGYLEALREVPGLLSVLMIAMILRRPMPIAAGVAIIIMGLGIMAFSVASTVVALALFSLFWSIGFHCWIPLEQAMALRYSPPGEKGRWLGRLRSVNSAAWLAAIGGCILAMRFVGYPGLFIAAGIVTAIGGGVLMFATREPAADMEKRLVFKRRYRLYYALNFLQGCRKQTFITFAIFALVKVHGMPVETTMILVLINQILVTLTGPLMGRLVDRFGERAMLSASYAGLVFVFLGYAIVEHRPSLYVLYCIDNLIFFGGIALTTYLHKIAPQEELKPTLSMGVTMNHVAAVAAPLIGGLAWYHFGYKIIFFSGSILAFISVIVCQWVRTDKGGQDERVLEQ
ncbi:MAG: MFS transporter [Lentisphaeria bacterium]|nr:MFS transporter [Lentisphaeria bacterium]